MTYLIALCDDEAAELNKTTILLSAYENKHPELDFMIECFESAGELLHMVEERDYAPDLIFMDIFMPGQEGTTVSLGIDTAKRLRDMGNRAKLFFLTMSREYALEAFDVDASQYLLKPIAEDKITAVLDRFVAETEEERKKYILLKIEGRTVRVAVKDIIYCEAQGKMQCMYLADGGEHLLRMTMTELYEMLSGCREFVRVGASYIMNLEHMGSLTAQEIALDNGQKIYLPRGTYSCLREQYFEYYCQNG
ncbi:MAG: LytTR family DNA-binding domain-containing protein [Lachnospiraceae bacterium]|nr:LytTR family DNA-binding domain-containing protein [Lachnospiraceae bacterium]